MEEIKKYWFLITFIVAGIGGAAIWIANIDSKTFESPSQREKHENLCNPRLYGRQGQRYGRHFHSLPRR